MKGRNEDYVAVIIFLSLVSCCTAVSMRGLGGAAGTFGNAIKNFGNPEGGLAVANAVIGTTSRSRTVGIGMMKLRQEEEEEMSLSLKLSITTLAVGDISGGVVLPVAQNVIDEIVKNQIFEASKEAFKFDEAPAELLDFFNSPADDAAQDAAKKFLYDRKRGIKKTLESDVTDVLAQAVDRRLARKINKVKNIFKVKALGKALGPVFDIINIGMSIDGLVGAAKECHQGETCPVGAIVCSSMGIVSGLLGIASIAFPALAPFALVFGIAATLVELFWQPPSPPLPELFLEQKRYDLNAGRMQQMDVYSRMQLEAVGNFLRESGEITDINVYVVNQGHFPNWMEENIEEPEERLSGPLTFGGDGDNAYNGYGIYKKTIIVKGQCRDTTQSFQNRSNDIIAASDTVCEYYQEGSGDLDTETRFPGTDKHFHYLGPDFYGLPVASQHERKNSERSTYEGQDGSSLRGVMVLVPTDRVTNRKLVGAEGPETYTTPVKIRGLHIDTEERRRYKGVASSSQQYNDVVAIGDMVNLGYKYEDGRHMVVIDTGNSGRDVLIIDGWVKKLEAQLGSNHNTLSFRTISQSLQARRRQSEDRQEKEKEIKGIKFNPGSGQVIMLGYDEYAAYNVVEHALGHVRGVGVLDASPFHDEITLFALEKDDTNPGDHFTVFKTTGTATYIFDANDYKSARFGSGDVHFKISDWSAQCEHASSPLLKIINMHNSAATKDVRYKDNKIHIYGSDGTELASITFATKCPGKVSATKANNAELFAIKLITDLVIMDYTGQRFDHDFSKSTVGNTRQDDIVHLHCPTSGVRSDKSVKNVKTVVVNDAFFEECGIWKDEGKGDNEILVTWSGNTMKWKFPDDGEIKAVQTFKGVEKLLNQFGATIVDLAGKRPFSLYKSYLDTLGEAMIRQSDIAPVVRNNLNMCILKKSNLEKIKRSDVTDGLRDFGKKEITDECE